MKEVFREGRSWLGRDDVYVNDVHQKTAEKGEGQVLSPKREKNNVQMVRERKGG